MTKLSVITINFNDFKGLQKTIESVINQTYLNYEFIIIDGGSNDDSKSVIERYQSKITHWVSEKDNGIYDAMNKGILKSSGEYLLFLNSGDYLINSNVLKKVFILNPQEDVLYGELIFDFGNKNKKKAKLPKQLTALHLFKDNIWHPASFIKKELFKMYGYYNMTYKIAADYDFFFKTIVVNKVSTKYIDFPITVYDTSGLSSNSASLKKINDERKKIHKRYLSSDEYEYFDNLSKFKFIFLSKWLVRKPLMTKFFTKLLKCYSQIRN